MLQILAWRSHVDTPQERSTRCRCARQSVRLTGRQRAMVHPPRPRVADDRACRSGPFAASGTAGRLRPNRHGHHLSATVLCGSVVDRCGTRRGPRPGSTGSWTTPMACPVSAATPGNTPSSRREGGSYGYRHRSWNTPLDHPGSRARPVDSGCALIRAPAPVDRCPERLSSVRCWQAVLPAFRRRPAIASVPGSGLRRVVTQTREGRV